MSAETSRRSNIVSPLRQPGQDGLSNWLAQITDLAIAAVVFVAPLFMGGRGPVGRLVLVAIISIAAIAWFVRQCLMEKPRWRWSGAESLVLLGGLIVVFQLVPMSSGLLHWVSPPLKDLLPMWDNVPNNPLHLGSWSTISLTPEDTRSGLVIYIAYAMLFVVLTQRLETVADIERILKWVAMAAVGMAVLGMLQLVAGNGKFLWVYDHPSRDTMDKVNGTFQNQNHFAHFLALGAGPLLWWLQKMWSAPPRSASFSSRTKRDSSNSLATALKHALAVGLVILIVACLLSFSRGGVIALAVALLVTVLIYFWKSLLGKRSLITVGAFVVLVCIALMIYGRDRLSAKMTSLASGSMKQVSNSRLELWKAHWRAIPQFPILGTGVGSHREVYPVYMEEQFDVHYSHGENGYFQLLLETGFCGFALLSIGFAFVLRWCIAPLFSPGTPLSGVAISGAILSGVVANLVHSSGDFVWYIPACMSLMIVLAACACRLFQLNKCGLLHELTDTIKPNRSEKSQVFLPRLAAISIAMIVTVAALGMTRNRLGPALASPHWDAYMRLALIKGPEDFSVNFGDPAAEREKLATIEQHLQQYLRHNPTDALALMKMAAVQLRRFEFEQKFAANPMGLQQIRDAALASQFPTRESQDEWLKVAIGENRNLLDSALHYCRGALRLSPLQGNGYIYMADLCFLEDPRESSKHAYIRQAYQVRPHNGLVLFAIGMEAALEKNEEEAIRVWKPAFKRDPAVRTILIQSLARELPAAMFIETFEPDTESLGELYRYYREIELTEDARIAGEKFATALCEVHPEDSPRRASECLDHAASVYAWLGRIDRALACEARAVELSPSDFYLHRALASYLAQSKRYAEAIEHLEWCLRRQPDDTALREDLAAFKLQMSSPQEAVERSARQPGVAKENRGVPYR